MRPRPVVGKAAVPDAVRRLMDKFDYPERQTPTQLVPILPTLGGGSGTGAYIHLTRTATQSIASGGELIDWDTLGLQGISGFSQSVSTTTVTVTQAGYYNIAVQLGWSSFEGGGTITILKNGLSVWPPADDPGLWSTTDGQFFEGTAPAIDCKISDVLSVNLNPDDASAQTLASATLAVYLVDRAANESLYRELVLSHGPLGYWRLGESSGATAVDEAGARDMTYISGPTLGVVGVMQDGSGDLAADFTGSEYVQGGDWAEFEFSGAAAFTIECWFADDLLDGAGVVHELVVKQETDEDGWELMTLETAGTRYLVGIRGTSGGDEAVGGSGVAASALTIGQSYYAAWTFDGTTQRLYLDGALIDSNVASTSMDATTARLNIGQRDATASSHMEGKIDEVAIYTRALTAAEIQEHFIVGGG